MSAGTWPPLLDAALRGALWASLLLIAVAMARWARTQPLARVGVAFAAGLAVQTAASLPAIERGWPIGGQAPLVAVSIGNTVLFWLFVRALFDDAFTLRPRHAALWLAVAAVGGGFCASMALFGPHAPTTVALRAVLRAVPAVFALRRTRGSPRRSTVRCPSSAAAPQRVGALR